MKKIIVIIIAIFSAFAINAQINYGTNTVTGSNASAIGNNNTASNTEAFAGGIDSQALGKYSLAFGNEAIAGQRNGISLGYRAFIYGPYSVGIGENIQTTTTSAMVIGVGADDNNPLVNSNSRSLMIGYNSDIPTLYVGSSLGVGTIGKVGIGTTTPTALLDINGTLNVSDVATFGSKITTNQLQVATGAGANKVMTSDAAGNATWENINSIVPESIWSENNGNPYITNAYVGIGTNDPIAELEIAKDISSSGKVGLAIVNSGHYPWFIGMDTDHFNTNSLVFADANQMENSKAKMIILSNGKVGIGTDIPTERLTVKGNIKCEQIEVIENVPASDFVFEEDYALMDIKSLDAYVTENHHLPEIPSAAEFKANGYNMNDMDDLLLRKVEELTLYIIALEKKVDVLENNKK